MAFHPGARHKQAVHLVLVSLINLWFKFMNERDMLSMLN